MHFSVNSVLSVAEYGIIIGKLENLTRDIPMNFTYYKSRLRRKGQITVPPEIRALLGAGEGDDLLFSTDERNQVIVSRAQTIDPGQAWFWSERWQRVEREAQADLDEGRLLEFASLEEALRALDLAASSGDAED